jgi:hypothetical protein
MERPCHKNSLREDHSKESYFTADPNQRSRQLNDQDSELVCLKNVDSKEIAANPHLRNFKYALKVANKNAHKNKKKFSTL